MGSREKNLSKKNLEKNWDYTGVANELLRFSPQFQNLNYTPECHQNFFGQHFSHLGWPMWFFWQFVCFRPKKGWGQKTNGKNSAFCVFFLKNDQILTNTKIFKIRFFFHRNPPTSPQHLFKHISTNFEVK